MSERPKTTSGKAVRPPAPPRRRMPPLKEDPEPPASVPVSTPSPADELPQAKVAAAANAALLSQTGSAIEPASLLFDVIWYRQTYPDVAIAKVDPVRHYFENGVPEGRNPNAVFVTQWYLETYPDVVQSGMNPFLHYLLYGAGEGRRCRPA